MDRTGPVAYRGLGQAWGRPGLRRKGLIMSHNRLGDTGRSTASPGVARSMVETFCREKTPVTLLALDSQETSQARFDSVQENCFVVQLFGDSAALNTSSDFVFVLTRNNQAHAFVSSVREHNTDSTPPQLRAILPEEIAVEGRRAVRIPISDDYEPSVRLQTSKGHQLTARAADISLAGIQLRFSEGAVPNLPIGAQIGLVIDLDHDSASLEGIVRWRRDAAYGVEFVPPNDQASLEAPGPLARIVHHLEQSWFKRS